MKRLLSLLLAVLCAASLTACGGGAEPPSVDESGGVLDFRLGEGTSQETPGEVTFPLDGLLGVPEADHCPVVFILHGAHGVDDVTENRYYQGFGYLVESLARQGYLAVSININRAFSVEPFEGDEYTRAKAIFDQYYDLLRRANDGEQVFDQDLTGKADLTKLNFIGHSRGGDDALSIAKTLRDGGDDSVRSVLLVASPLMVPAERSYTDVPTGVILSQYDGDVTGLETATLFNRAWFLDDARQTPVTMAFLYGANHNQYNTAIAQEDSLAPPQGVTYLDGATQREFLCLYAADFLNAFNRDGDVSALLGEDAPNRYGIDFMPSVLLPGGERYLPDEAGLALAETDGMDLSAAVFSQVPASNTIAPFNPPGPLPEDITLYRLRWSALGQSVTLPLGDTDWTAWSTLSLLIANDSTAPGNDGAVPLAFDIIVTDVSGACATVTLESDTAAALRHQPTAVIDLFQGMDGLPEYFMAERHTPLGVLALPLDSFRGVDLSHVASVTLRGESSTGACILGGARVN